MLTMRFNRKDGTTKDIGILEEDVDAYIRASLHSWEYMKDKRLESQTASIEIFETP